MKAPIAMSAGRFPHHKEITQPIPAYSAMPAIMRLEIVHAALSIAGEVGAPVGVDDDGVER